eukprot:13760_1
MNKTKINVIESKTNSMTIQKPLSPKSPITPPTGPSSLSNAINEIAKEYKRNEEILSTIKQIGFDHTTAIKITNTLQGTVWKANRINKSNKTKSSVIKVTNKFLYQNSAAIIDNKLYRVSEDIISEKDILKYLSQDKNCPDSIVQFQGFLQTADDYWLIMEYGGESLFDFVTKAHQLIKRGVIDRENWNKMVIVIFKQMIECISYIHSKNVAHFDISLENFLINDVKIGIKSDSNIEKIMFDVNDVHIKLCDFGLAHKFTKYNFVSKKWCGKTAYKSPEVYNKQNKFLADMNDIWCIGICYFMLLTGGNPWCFAHESDKAFVYAKNNSVEQLLKCWNIDYVNKHSIFLLESIFQCENERISLSDIKKYFYKFMCIV